MNPITYALNQVRFEIPREILEKLFITQFAAQHCYYKPTPISLDARIRDEVITPRVLMDCNMMGGTETHIRLTGLPREDVDAFTYVYRIPKTLTQGRSITAALSVTFGEGAVVGATNLVPMRGNVLLDAASGLLNSSTPIPMISTAKVKLIGENTILIADNMSMPTNIFLRCWLENDTNFNHINPRSYPAFSKLVVLAVKAYIYVNAMIPMDMGEIFAGNQLGRFKEVIDSYSDANEMYMTHLTEVWGRVAVLNDFDAHRRHIQLLVGGAN